MEKFRRGAAGLRAPEQAAGDEPNANLNAEGENAVIEAVRSVRARSGIAIIIAHRPSAVAAVDLLLVMKGGDMIAFGPRDEVLNKTVQNAAKIIPMPVKREGAE